MASAAAVNDKTIILCTNDVCPMSRRCFRYMEAMTISSADANVPIKKFHFAQRGNDVSCDRFIEIEKIPPAKTKLPFNPVIQAQSAPVHEQVKAPVATKKHKNTRPDREQLRKQNIQLAVWLEEGYDNALIRSRYKETYNVELGYHKLRQLRSGVYYGSDKEVFESFMRTVKKTNKNVENDSGPQFPVDACAKYMYAAMRREGIASVHVHIDGTVEMQRMQTQTFTVTE